MQGRGKFDDTGRCVRFTGLPQSFAWQELKDLCKKHGRVIRTDVPRGSGNGTAVFEMEEDAKKALAQLDGLEVGGSTIRARMDDGSGGGNQGGDQGRGGGGGKVPLARPRPRGKGNGGRFDDSGRILYFTNLPLSFAWQELKDLCKMYGKVIRADVTRGSGCGTCVFEEVEEAQLVLQQLNGHTVQGCVVGVAPDEEGALVAQQNANNNVGAAPTPAEAAAAAADPSGATGEPTAAGGFEAGFEGGFDYNVEGGFDPNFQGEGFEGIPGMGMGGVEGVEGINAAFAGMGMFGGPGEADPAYQPMNMFGNPDPYGMQQQFAPGDPNQQAMAFPGSGALGPPGMADGQPMPYGAFPQQPGSWAPMGGFGGFMQQQPGSQFNGVPGSGPGGGLSGGDPNFPAMPASSAPGSGAPTGGDAPKAN